MLDYLRACKATSQDLTEFLDGYLGSPLPIPSRPTRGPRIPKPKQEDLALLALRKEAAWWNLREVVEVMLHHELNGLGAKPMSKERKLVAEYGRKVFRILYQTRQLRPALRERRLKRCRAWAERKAVQADVIDYLCKAVAGLFEDMEVKGELDWLPPAEQAKHLMLLSPRHRPETDYDLCRTEWLARMYKEQVWPSSCALAVSLSFELSAAGESIRVGGGSFSLGRHLDQSRQRVSPLSGTRFVHRYFQSSPEQDSVQCVIQNASQWGINTHQVAAPPRIRGGS